MVVIAALGSVLMAVAIVLVCARHRQARPGEVSLPLPEDRTHCRFKGPRQLFFQAGATRPGSRVTAMKQALYTIGQLAARAGCKVQTIRYYEQIGLMPPPARTIGNQRIYQREHADRLAFVRHSRELGFPLDAIRELLDLADDPDRSCDAADSIARRQLRQVESRMARLEALKGELERMIVQCGGGRIAECRVIEVLADHNLCASNHREPPLDDSTTPF
jgi:DNA-binding transcriptional MerR regulator